jgi:Ca2+-binding EF-hand superfamily protein
MGNKQSASPFRNYETASSNFTAEDLGIITKAFRDKSERKDFIDIEAFSIGSKARISIYSRCYILPRLLRIVDTKCDNRIDFEEYVCAISLFRVGTKEDKVRLLFLMYDEGQKNGGHYISRAGLTRC